MCLKKKMIEIKVISEKVESVEIRQNDSGQSALSNYFKYLLSFQIGLSSYKTKYLVDL